MTLGHPPSPGSSNNPRPQWPYLPPRPSGLGPEPGALPEPGGVTDWDDPPRSAERSPHTSVTFAMVKRSTRRARKRPECSLRRRRRRSASSALRDLPRRSPRRSRRGAGLSSRRFSSRFLMWSHPAGVRTCFAADWRRSRKRLMLSSRLTRRSSPRFCGSSGKWLVNSNR